MSDILQAVLDWFEFVILLLPRLIFWGALQLLEVALDMLPGLEIADPATLASGFSGDMLYFLTIMEFDYGLTAVVSALIARFLLRRLPFIG